MTEKKAPDCQNGHGPMMFESRGVDGAEYSCPGCPGRCLDKGDPAFAWMWSSTKTDEKVFYQS